MTTAASQWHGGKSRELCVTVQGLVPLLSISFPGNPFSLPWVERWSVPYVCRYVELQSCLALTSSFFRDKNAEMMRCSVLEKR